MGADDRTAGGLTSHRTVFEQTPHQDVGDVIGYHQRVDEGETPETLGLSVDVWQAMGYPDVVTITVEPGDQLNT